ncbi:hypothetical protein DFH29DRAFT_876504 [Suillus ampliporus]|nr:hypothetical protein DFH29DRAFT_876504 [Suillus ampliporus]
MPLLEGGVKKVWKPSCGTGMEHYLHRKEVKEGTIQYYSKVYQATKDSTSLPTNLSEKETIERKGSIVEDEDEDKAGSECDEREESDSDDKDEIEVEKIVGLKILKPIMIPIYLKKDSESSVSKYSRIKVETMMKTNHLKVDSEVLKALANAADLNCLISQKNLIEEAQTHLEHNKKSTTSSFQDILEMSSQEASFSSNLAQFYLENWDNTTAFSILHDIINTMAAIPATLVHRDKADKTAQFAFWQTDCTILTIYNWLSITGPHFAYMHYVEAVLEVKDGNYDSTSLEKKREVPGELFSLNSGDTKYLLVVKASQLQHLYGQHLTIAAGTVLSAVVKHFGGNDAILATSGWHKLEENIRLFSQQNSNHSAPKPSQYSHMPWAKDLPLIPRNLLPSSGLNYGSLAVVMHESFNQHYDHLTEDEYVSFYPKVWEKFCHHLELPGQQAIGKRANSTTTMTIEEKIKPSDVQQTWLMLLGVMAVLWDWLAQCKFNVFMSGLTLLQFCYNMVVLNIADLWKNSTKIVF